MVGLVSPPSATTGPGLFRSLLDELEKEEVLVVEKDQSGATHVHGAQDVTGLRRDARLYAKYRSGALGGVPRFG